MPKQKLVTLNQETIAYDPAEPFYILDPRNAYAPSALRALVNTLNNAGGNDGQLAAMDVEQALRDMEAWQANNHTEVAPPKPRSTGSIPGLHPEDFADITEED